jgi:4a-hydroxytetrahydrobiopterin dehydratase
MPYADPLTDDEIARGLDGLDGWERDGDTIRRTARVAGFRAAADLIGAVATEADAANHHPDIHLTGYRNVTFVLTTHAAHAITRRDIELAAAIDRLILGAA